jgi:hypothetical protein
LRWAQVDLEAGRIDFTSPDQRRTNKRRGRIPIPAKLLPHLRRARARGTELGFVVHDNGARLNDIKRGFASACTRAGLEAVIPHTLRHSCATWLMQQGVDKWEASGFLAMTVETLERVYGHHHPDSSGARTSATQDPHAGRISRAQAQVRRDDQGCEASDRVCGKRLKVMIPTLLAALERHGRLRLGQADRDRVLAVSAATVDRLLSDVKVTASGGKRRRAGFYSAIRREVPIRTFNDWKGPPPGFCEVDMVAHGGKSVAGSFIQTLTMVDIATGWTECLPLVTRDGSLVVEAINRAQSLFPWLLRGVDFDNDSAFMNDVVVPWCREQKLEVTRSRAYKKNDQAFVEQKNGAVVRRLMGYGRFEGVETARVMGRL